MRFRYLKIKQKNRDTFKTNAAVSSPKQSVSNLSPSETKRDNSNQENFGRYTQNINNNEMFFEADNNQRLTIQKLSFANKGIYFLYFW